MFTYSPPSQLDFKNSGLVVDTLNQPLGIMPVKTIHEQKLLHRSVAVFLRDRFGRLFLGSSASRGFGFSGIGVLPPFMIATDYGLELVAEYVKSQLVNIRLAGVYSPCPENHNSFTYVLEGIMHRLPCHPVHLCVDRGEYEGLANLDYKICPLFRLLVSSGWLVWS